MNFTCRLKWQYLLIFIFILCSLPSELHAYNVAAKLGSSGEQVEQIQAMLSEVGVYYGAQDGDFGQQTEQAVKTFQKSVRRAPTGIVDKYLYKLLIYKSRLDLSKVKKTWTMEATAYSPEDPGCSGSTSTGSVLKKGIVAVDPRIIPLGTKLYILGYGRAIADDQGGAIKGNIIDIAFDSRAEALRFGRRSVKVYKI